MDENILSYEDHQNIQNDAWENGFQKDLNILTEQEKQTIKEYYQQLQTCQQKINNAIKNETIKIREYETLIGNLKINRKEYSTINKDIQMTFLEATQILYKLRTLITGEEIYFLENFDGEEKVIKQQDWISQLGVTSNAITLTEKAINSIQTTELLSKSSIFSSLTQNYNIEKDLIESAGSFNWPIDKGELIDSEKKIYKKNKRDFNVYAYWRTNNHNVTLLWQNKIVYNLGELYEAAIERFEQVANLDESVIMQFKEKLNSDTPLDVIFGEFNILSQYNKSGRSVQGLKEGDFRTSKNFWVQSKRGNSKVISLTQVYNYLNRILTILSKLTQQENFNKTNTILKNNVIQQFINAYYSDKKIDDNIKKRIKQLPFFNQL